MYSYYETNMFKYRLYRERRMHRKYGLIIENLLDQISENKYRYNEQNNEIENKLFKNKYFTIVFIKRFLSRIKKYSGKDKTLYHREKKYLLNYAWKTKLYESVINFSKFFGEYNTLAILSVIRDKRSLPIFEEYETIFLRKKNTILAYYVLLGYARIGEMERFKETFTYIINHREITSEEMYVGLLISFNGDVSSWQEKVLLHDNINHKIIALKYFMEIRQDKYTMFCLQEIQHLLEYDKIDSEQIQYFILLNQYLETFYPSYNREELMSQVSNLTNKTFLAILESMEVLV